MVKRTQLLLSAGLVILAGCGNDRIDLSCDDPALYQQAVQGKRLEVPEGLDNLNPAKEMPVPDAAPLTPRPVGSPCLDLPPRYLKSEEAKDAPEDTPEQASDEEK